jgi:hypothetical protein
MAPVCARGLLFDPAGSVVFPAVRRSRLLSLATADVHGLPPQSGNKLLRGLLDQSRFADFNG